jgi:hypothetical protein
VKRTLETLTFALPLIAALALTAAVPVRAQAPAAAQAPGSLVFKDYRAPVPTAWQSQPPSSSMRVAQYRVPAAPGSGGGEAVVFYFGKGQGGAVEANIERWASQFSNPDGRPVIPRVQKLTANGLAVTIVELNGSYARGVGTGPQGEAKPNQTLLVAVVETPEGNVTIQLYGSKETVAAQRKGFDAMVRGFKKTA